MVKNKKATTNPKNNDTMCIKHVEMVALNQKNGKRSTKNTKDWTVNRPV